MRSDGAVAPARSCGGPLPRTCAAWAIDRLVVSKLLNHAEGGVTKIYDRYTADPEQAAAVERWANRLREIITGAPATNVVQLRIQ